METYKEPKELVENPYYQAQRQKKLASLSDSMIDEPIIEIVNGFNKLHHCFTLQSCYGHFVYSGQKNPHNLEPLPVTDTITRVEYRIAYIAICIENSASGRGLFKDLKGITAIDPENIQFCCADWFWKRQVNSYALQVEPDRFKRKDKAILDYKKRCTLKRYEMSFLFGLMNYLKMQRKDQTG